MTQEQAIPDLVLIKRFCRGSIEAFEELITRYESKIYNLAMRFTRNPEDAEEVLQDVFATLYRKLDGFEGKSQFSSWLYRIIVNAAFMKLRKRKQDNTVSIEDLSPTMRQICVDRDPLTSVRSDNISINRELRDMLQAAIERLPEQYRAVFVLRDVDGLSNQEVGEILDLSIPAVKSRLHRSRLMLRKRLRNYHDEYMGIKPKRRRARSHEALIANA